MYYIPPLSLPRLCRSGERLIMYLVQNWTFDCLVGAAYSTIQPMAVHLAKQQNTRKKGTVLAVNRRSVSELVAERHELKNYRMGVAKLKRDFFEWWKMPLLKGDRCRQPRRVAMSLFFQSCLPLGSTSTKWLVFFHIVHLKTLSLHNIFILRNFPGGWS